MKHKAKRGHYTWTDISSALVMVGICVAFASIILVLVLAWLDPIESETRVTGILTGVYQPPIDDSDVPPPVRLLVRLDASQERVEVPLSEPTPFRPRKRVLLVERTTKHGLRIYRFERYLDPEEERELLRDRWPQ
jgi:hypothetical protein